jgi:ribonuclease HI
MPGDQGVTIVYTDGSCHGNPGPGGWAWAVPDGPYASGAEARTTNQRMELTAVLRALEALPGALEVVSDSTYVVRCFQDRWWEGWRRRGWRNASGRPVANRDLWEQVLAAAVDAGRTVGFRWVKGHADDPMNALVDALANRAAGRQVGERGQVGPRALLAADQPVP